MKKTLFLLSFAALANCNAETIDFKAILTSICDNNKQLATLRQANQAEIDDQKTDNTLGETSVEYSPFFRKGVNGLATSELIVAQEFSFPTLYATRNKTIEKSRRVLDSEYMVTKRDIMVEAAKLCVDFATAIENKAIISQRLATADSLLSIYNKRMAAGDVSALETNRIKIDRMAILTLAAQNEGEITQLKLSLQRLGASPAALEGLMPSDPMSAIANNVSTLGTPEMSLANSSLDLAQQRLSMARQEWLPSIKLGYRRNTEHGENSFNGPLVGISMPLFANSRKIKAAKQRQAAAQLEVENTRHLVANRQQSLNEETKSLKQQLATYDTALMQQSLATLLKAVAAGEVSIIEYYREADLIYNTMQERLTVENNYYKALVEQKTLSPLGQ
ncbi:MAG: TolC family protein [Bacteroidaceae bacterium]